MGLFGFGKKRQAERALKELHEAKDLGEMSNVLLKSGVISKPKSANHNSLGQRVDALTPDGELPFGWVHYRKDFVSKVYAEQEAFFDEIRKTKEPRQRIAALESYARYLEDGKKHYAQIGKCEGKFFEEYIIDSTATKAFMKELKQLKKAHK